MCSRWTGEEGKVWGFGGEPSGWGRGRWNGALSFYLLETSPPSRPRPHTQPVRLATPPQLAGKSSPPTIRRLLTDVLGKGGLREGRAELGCREGKVKAGGGNSWKKRERGCGQVGKPVKMRRSQGETAGEKGPPLCSSPSSLQANSSSKTKAQRMFLLSVRPCLASTF